MEQPSYPATGRESIRPSGGACLVRLRSVGEGGGPGCRGPRPAGGYVPAGVAGRLIIGREALPLELESARHSAVVRVAHPVGEAGRLLEWRARDRQKQLRGFRLVEPTGQGTCRFTEVVEVRLLGALRPFGPLVVWLLRRQSRPDLRRLKHLLEARTPADQPRRGRRPTP